MKKNKKIVCKHINYTEHNGAILCLDCNTLLSDFHRYGIFEAVLQTINNYLPIDDETLAETSIDRDLAKELVALYPKEIVICAAIKTKDGQIIRGHRHADCYHTAVERMRVDSLTAANADQGFVTSHNRYVTREEGRKLQDAAGIPSASPEGYMPDTLFSEDLY